MRTGQVDRPVDLSREPLAAYVPETDGGFTYYPAVGTDSGTFSIRHVPPDATYYLQVGRDYIATSERADFDLSYYVQGS